MNEFRQSHGLSTRRDGAMVTSSVRVHASRDELPDEFARYPVELTRKKGSLQDPNKKGKKWAKLSDPELKRKKRIAKYKIYSMEGKVKSSLRKGLRWFKNKVSVLVHGY